MSNESTIYDQIDDIRKGTIAILEALTARAYDFQLIEVPATFADYRPIYKVLVVGETKHGKSSFINALIGRGILAVNAILIETHPLDVYNIAEKTGSPVWTGFGALSLYTVMQLPVWHLFGYQQ